MNSKQTQTAVAELLEAKSISGWISWLFDIQNALISHNHLEGYTEKGAKEFAGDFDSLKLFFDQLNVLSK